MTILLTLSVYQISIYNLLPNRASTVPYIGMYVLNEWSYIMTACNNISIHTYIVFSR